MATAPALVAPVPLYQIGQTIYVAATEGTVEQLPCPDCLGSKEWAVKSPAGGEYTTACPRCQSSYSLSRDLPSLKIERRIGKAQARLITGLEIDSNPDAFSNPITYRSRTSSSSYYTVREKDAYATEAEAQAVADAKAASLNTEADERPEVLTSRRFSNLNLDDARFDEFKNGVWNAHYHAGNLLERVKSALHGESGEEERDTAEIIESLKEAARWDFAYHIEHLPLVPLVKAALASDDAAVREAVEALPEAMVALLSGKTLADMQPKACGHE